MLARDLMTPFPAVVLPATPVHQAATLMRDRDVGFLPVVEATDTMRLMGVVTDRDLALRCLAAHRGGAAPVSDFMSAGSLLSVRPEAEVHDVIARMERAQVRRVPVIDDTGRVLGVIAQADIARRLGPIEPVQVEEFVARVSTPGGRWS